MATKKKVSKANKFLATAKALTQDLPATTPAPTDAAETTKPAKATKKAKPDAQAKKEAKAKKMSALDAAAKVLGETKEAMTTPEMIDAMGKKGYWSSPKGLTPASTLYAAIAREVNTKGKDSRFAKTERGKFALKA